MCSSADERLVIGHYFETGLRYDTIVHFLCEYQEICMNVRTLKRKLRQYGHLYICRSLFGHSTFFVASLVFMQLVYEELFILCNKVVPPGT